ncbi:MAG: site-specific integrase [Bacteroidota bacterium]|nr:site-specific integrase [Bacteroidota bacterium]
MSVTLRKRKNLDGTTSLLLDIYYNDGEKGVRVREFLKHLKLSKPSNLLDRESNKKKLQQAEEIAIARAAELEANNYGMITDIGKKTLITTWMQSYVDTYKKADKRNMSGALQRFKDFLKEENKERLTFANITPLLIEDFIEFLEHKSSGEGASSYYNRFKKMLKHAYRKKLMRENILDQVERKVKGKAKKKDILTIDELKTLNATPIESDEVRKAFLFCCVTGLRWIDVKPLTWECVNMQNKQMVITQKKTGEEVTIPLNETAIQLIGKKRKPKEPVFNLPTANGANKTLKAWVKRAQIEKKITWHNARHSFGTNLIYNDVDVLTASKLLGHTTLKHTQRYVDAAEEMKQKATNKLNLNI